MKGPIYTRIVALNGLVDDGEEQKSLEEAMNDLSDQGATLVSHQLTLSDPSLDATLVEVVIMAKEAVA